MLTCLKQQAQRTHDYSEKIKELSFGSLILSSAVAVSFGSLDSDSRTNLRSIFVILHSAQIGI